MTHILTPPNLDKKNKNNVLAPSTWHDSFKKVCG